MLKKRVRFLKIARDSFIRRRILLAAHYADLLTCWHVHCIQHTDIKVVDVYCDFQPLWDPYTSIQDKINSNNELLVWTTDILLIEINSLFSPLISDDFDHFCREGQRGHEMVVLENNYLHMTNKILWCDLNNEKLKITMLGTNTMCHFCTCYANCFLEEDPEEETLYFNFKDCTDLRKLSIHMMTDLQCNVPLNSEWVLIPIFQTSYRSRH